jgi:CelD/BcsL family acetyltransferase involved in cellulose biosynthesis
MTQWHTRSVPFKFQLSDWTLCSVSIYLQVRSEQLIEQTPPVEEPRPPIDDLMEGSQGFLIRGLPIARELPPLSRLGDYLRYIPIQYRHCYIDLGLSFESYQQKFSSKTRSTIKRKIKKYSEHCGGTILWKTYQEPSRMQEFFRLARAVSRLTYQERLLDAGIPESEEFIQQAESLAANKQLRAYILFDRERPVAYLYCPVQDGVLVYAYLGYDPAYMHLSVGTVLQWLAVEQVFKEACFRMFDFTEGESDHKRLFATHQRQCANVFLVKSSFRNTVLLYSHLFVDRLSGRIGTILDRWGVKARIKRFMRFAR